MLLRNDYADMNQLDEELHADFMKLDQMENEGNNKVKDLDVSDSYRKIYGHNIRKFM